MDIKSIFQKGLQAVIELVNSLYSQIQNLTEKVGELTSKIAELEQRLKEKTDQKVKDSHNSSKPSSTDGLKKRTKSLRQKSERASGGQKGHKGTTLSMVSNPDKVEKILLQNCKSCGRSLRKVEKTMQNRQVIEIAVSRMVTEYQGECADCPDCKCHSVAEFPEFCKKKIQYGPGLKALTVYFSKYQLIPLRRTVELFKDIFGVNMSESTIVNTSRESYDQLEAFEAACKDSLIKAPLIHNDESGGRCEKKLKWFQVTSTNLLTFFAFHAKRGSEAMNDIGILPKFKGKSVHDFFKSYFTYTCEHILCNAHLLRELIFEYEINSQRWANKIIQLLLEIKKEVEKAKGKENSNSLSKMKLEKYDKKFDRIIRNGLKYNPYQIKDSPKRGKAKQTTSRNLLDRLKNHREKYLAFMYDFKVPFDNNLAERDIRMLKLYMKISGCFRTFTGASHFCRIRSYMSTVRKNNLNMLDSIQNIFLGKPFIPKYAE